MGLFSGNDGGKQRNRQGGGVEEAPPMPGEETEEQQRRRRREQDGLFQDGDGEQPDQDRQQEVEQPPPTPPGSSIPEPGQQNQQEVEQPPPTPPGSDIKPPQQERSTKEAVKDRLAAVFGRAQDAAGNVRGRIRQVLARSDTPDPEGELSEAERERLRQVARERGLPAPEDREDFEILRQLEDVEQAEQGGFTEAERQSLLFGEQRVEEGEQVSKLAEMKEKVRSQLQRVKKSSAKQFKVGGESSGKTVSKDKLVSQLRDRLQSLSQRQEQQKEDIGVLTQVAESGQAADPLGGVTAEQRFEQLSQTQQYAAGARTILQPQEFLVAAKAATEGREAAEDVIEREFTELAVQGPPGPAELTMDVLGSPVGLAATSIAGGVAITRGIQAGAAVSPALGTALESGAQVAGAGILGFESGIIASKALQGKETEALARGLRLGVATAGFATGAAAASGREVLPRTTRAVTEGVRRFRNIGKRRVGGLGGRGRPGSRTVTTSGDRLSVERAKRIAERLEARNRQVRAMETARELRIQELRTEIAEMGPAFSPRTGFTASTGAAAVGARIATTQNRFLPGATTGREIERVETASMQRQEMLDINVVDERGRTDLDTVENVIEETQTDTEVTVRQRESTRQQRRQVEKSRTDTRTLQKTDIETPVNKITTQQMKFERLKPQKIEVMEKLETELGRRMQSKTRTRTGMFKLPNFDFDIGRQRFARAQEQAPSGGGVRSVPEIDVLSASKVELSGRRAVRPSREVVERFQEERERAGPLAELEAVPGTEATFELDVDLSFGGDDLV